MWEAEQIARSRGSAFLCLVSRHYGARHTQTPDAAFPRSRQGGGRPELITLSLKDRWLTLPQEHSVVVSPSPSPSPFSPRGEKLACFSVLDRCRRGGAPCAATLAAASV